MADKLGQGPEYDAWIDALSSLLWFSALRKKALEWLAAQHLPVDDWKLMERQIESR
jgi:hypothetical protein